MNTCKSTLHIRRMYLVSCYIVCVFISILVNGCATQDRSPSEIYKGHTAEQLYKGAEHALVQGNYKSAIQYYQALDALYPFGIYGERAHLHILYAYHMDKDEASAEAAALRFIRLYPRSPYVDYAYYMKGITNFEPSKATLWSFIPVDESKRALGEAQKSYRDFATLVHQFPNSIYTSDARQRMVYLRNLMAAYEYHVALFYFEHKAYVAAINRAETVFHDYFQAPAVIPALGIMAQSYGALGLPEQKEMALSLLALNFPDSNTYKALKSNS